MRLNAIYNTDFLNNKLPDKSCRLIIADPPYYRVKGEFDKAWINFDSYLQDVEKWAVECKRLLADNGTLIWWGHALRIAYTQIILDKYFSLLNVCVWRKTDAQANRCKPEQARRFVPVTERFLVYENDSTDGTEKFKSMKEYLRKERTNFMQVKNMKTLAEFNNFIDKYLGSMTVSRHSFTDSQFEFISEENYNKLQQLGMFTMAYNDISNEYVTLKHEYQKQRRHFEFPTNSNIHDVINVPLNTTITAKYKHPTQKSERLTALLIDVCSKISDLVCVPFAGSGTECAMAVKHNRNFIGFDINAKYCEIANERVEAIKEQENIFGDI